MGRRTRCCIFLLKDEVMVTLDTSGDSLHKRGYRTLTSKAPLTETLAGIPAYVDTVETGPYSRGSVLWKWYISD